MASDIEAEKTTAPFARRLCNFRTGQAQPLPTDEEFAKSELKSLLAKSPGAFIDLLGLAVHCQTPCGSRASFRLPTRTEEHHHQSFQEYYRVPQ